MELTHIYIHLHVIQTISPHFFRSCRLFHSYSLCYAVFNVLGMFFIAHPLYWKYWNDAMIGRGKQSSHEEKMGYGINHMCLYDYREQFILDTAHLRCVTQLLWRFKTNLYSVFWSPLWDFLDELQFDVLARSVTSGWIACFKCIVRPNFFLQNPCFCRKK